ncbi:ABC transporter permease [Opitutus sp. ER46]|uniref:ABC transporter permease n=1 Tax=Opitutus sp. ER46 TaxID=2161864 RepID=UPI000D318B4A|nr:ABC transporter permease [Opitutus sp. ER46]PTX91428.1 hypothetical protein DB354_16180 [Opitutus sp. ER46]
MHSFLQDLCHSFRLLARTPGFTLTAVLILALGIGANTAVFSLVQELLWLPQPFQEPQRIVQLYSQDQKDPRSFRLFSYGTYRDLAAQDQVFSGVLAHNLTMVGIGEGGEARRGFAAIVSSNYFSVLGVPLAQGRAFSAEEEQPGSRIPVVIASHAYWQRTGFDPALVGKTVRVNERLYTVVGITPPRFAGTMTIMGPELYFPLGVYDWVARGAANDGREVLNQRSAHELFLLGRLKPGMSVEAARPVLATMAENLGRSQPVDEKERVYFAGPLPRLSTSVSPTGRGGLGVIGGLLLGMAGIVLLISCLNLANLLLARGRARRKEIAVRLALGGSRARIVRQLLTEGAVLTLLGAAAGLLLARWGTDALVASMAARVPLALFFQGVTNGAAFAATLGFAALATLGFALGPALRLTGAARPEDLKEQPGEDAPTRRRRAWLPRHPLVVAQLALSLGLLCTAGLFVRGALKAARIDTGFRADATLLAELDTRLAGYDEGRALDVYRALVERLAALPGVEAASVGSVVPFGDTSMGREVRRAGLVLEPAARPATAAEGRGYQARWSSVGADYFRAMGLPLLRGRGFTSAEADQKGAPRVVVIDEVLARELYPDGNALGQRVEFGGPGRKPKPEDSMEVVGIVPATRWTFFKAEGEGAVYVPFAQGFESNAFLHVRVAGGAPEAAQALSDVVRREIRAGAPAVPLFRVKSFAQHLDGSIQLWVVRTGAVLFGSFGVLALLLAVVGVYGVKSYAVSRRTREIGIRMALGADGAKVRAMILREGVATIVAGLALGGLLGVALGQACRGLLYDVSAIDPVAFVTAIVVLTAAGLAACWFPARRATRISPMTALRTE